MSEEEKEALLKTLLYLIKEIFSSTLVLLQHTIYNKKSIETVFSVRDKKKLALSLL